MQQPQRQEPEPNEPGKPYSADFARRLREGPYGHLDLSDDEMELLEQSGLI